MIQKALWRCLPVLLAAGFFPLYAGPLRRLWNTAILPVRLAHLASLPADHVLSAPLHGKLNVVNTWFAERPGGRRHEGQDLYAPYGTTIFSATGGIVTAVGENHLGGNYVEVTGAGGRSYYYAHMDRQAPGLKTGDEVVAGTVLGYVGNTGNARTTASHLHFGIYTPMGVVDPLPLLMPE